MQRQAAAAVLPLGEEEEAAHGRHAASPVDLYVSALHIAHGPPPGPSNPATHTQSETSSLEDGESEFAGQAVHPALPPPALNVPPPQAWHGPPSGPVYPGSQRQEDSDVLATGELECSGHALHAPFPGAAL